MNAEYDTSRKLSYEQILVREHKKFKVTVIHVYPAIHSFHKLTSF